MNQINQNNHTTETHEKEKEILRNFLNSTMRKKEYYRHYENNELFIKLYYDNESINIKKLKLFVENLSLFQWWYIDDTKYYKKCIVINLKPQ
jgi:hypothetical protein